MPEPPGSSKVRWIRKTCGSHSMCRTASRSFADGRLLVEKLAMRNARLSLSLVGVLTLAEAFARRSSSGTTDRPAPLAGRSISPHPQGHWMEIVV